MTERELLAAERWEVAVAAYKAHLAEHRWGFQRPDPECVYCD